MITEKTPLQATATANEAGPSPVAMAITGRYHPVSGLSEREEKQYAREAFATPMIGCRFLMHPTGDERPTVVLEIIGNNNNGGIRRGG